MKAPLTSVPVSRMLPDPAGWTSRLRSYSAPTGSVADTIALAQQAEAQGYDDVWLADAGGLDALTLVPMILEKSVQAQFLIPMAISLAFGVVFSTVISLVLVPSIYLILEDLGRLNTLPIFPESLSLLVPDTEEFAGRTEIKWQELQLMPSTLTCFPPFMTC